MALLRHRKAATVAREFGITQSAVSHTLRRLRDVFGDPLFLRLPHGLEPTATALAVEPWVSEAVDRLGHAISGPSDFDPRSSEATLRIAASDYELATVMPGLIGRLARRAPGMKILATPSRRRDALEALTDRSVDMAIGFFVRHGNAFVDDPLFQEGFRVVVRRDHPVIAQELSIDRYLEVDHLIVSPGGDLRGVVDDVLESTGRARRVSVSLPLFLPALAAVAGSDLVATLPIRLVRRFAAAFGLADFDTPVPIDGFTVSALRHRRDAANPLHDWLVDELRASVAP